MKKLSILNVDGVDYDLEDKTSRLMIQEILKSQESTKNIIEMYKQGILELAETVKKLQNSQDNVKRTCLSVEDVSSFPILKFSSNFSILIDINIEVNDELYSSQQLIKYYNGKIYKSTIDENCIVDCYYQVKDNNIYLFFDIHYSNYNLAINTLSYDGNVPIILIDENKFSTDKYSSAIKLK